MTKDNYFIATSQHMYRDSLDIVQVVVQKETGEIYNAVSKDFNLNKAWKCTTFKNTVLLPLLEHLIAVDKGVENTNDFITHRHTIESAESKWYDKVVSTISNIKHWFDRSELKDQKRKLQQLLQKYGKTRNQIGTEIMNFIHDLSNSSETFLDHVRLYTIGDDHSWFAFNTLFKIDKETMFRTSGNIVPSLHTSINTQYRKLIDNITMTTGDDTESYRILKLLPDYPVSKYEINDPLHTIMDYMIQSKKFLDNRIIVMYYPTKPDVGYQHYGVFNETKSLNDLTADANETME